MKKSFVLDTNVLLHNANALHSFADNEVVIPIDVIEELDTFKNENNELGRNSRHVIRSLDKLRVRGNLGEGVQFADSEGSVRVVLQTGRLNGTGLDLGVADNRIISVAYEMKQNGKPVVFVSKDINARIKSDSLGIHTMDFEKEKVDIDTLFSGWRELTWPTDRIDRLYGSHALANDEELSPNECAYIRDETNPKHSALARCSSDAKELMLLHTKDLHPMGIRPRNKEQHFALDLLCDDNVELVTLVGQAGTGKTLLALACGLELALNDKKYEKVLITRPIMPLGKDIGFLPGSMEDKLGHWMKPIHDNLAYLLSLKGGGKLEKRVNEFLESGIVEMEALTYIRGRSIPNQYLIVDEAQNLTPHEVKTIVSRAGEGTKIVLTGDPYQIDNPYLDGSSNGLTYAAERLRGNAIVGHMTLTASERSGLASLAAEAL